MNSKNKDYLDRFIEYLKVERRYSYNTYIAYENDIAHFVEFLEKEEFGDLSDATTKVAEFYVSSLMDEYIPKTIQRKISSLKTIYHYYMDNLKEFDFNPFNKIVLPKPEKKLPKFIYDDEIDEFFNSIDITTETGLRDKLIFSLLYGSGLRVSELTSLELKDVNMNDRIITVHGKGSKDRMVPMSVESKDLYKEYIYKVRPILLSRSNILDNDNVFLNFKGTTLTSRGVRDILNRIIKDTESTLRVSPHTFRHTFATHLLNKGMDVRMVQELLGHENLSTTQIYTKISKENLIKEYEKAFPKGDSNK